MSICQPSTKICKICHLNLKQQQMCHLRKLTTWFHPDLKDTKNVPFGKKDAVRGPPLWSFMPVFCPNQITVILKVCRVFWKINGVYSLPPLFRVKCPIEWCVQTKNLCLVGKKCTPSLKSRCIKSNLWSMREKTSAMASVVVDIGDAGNCHVLVDSSCIL